MQSSFHNLISYLLKTYYLLIITELSKNIANIAIFNNQALWIELTFIYNAYTDIPIYYTNLYTNTANFVDFGVEL